MRVIARKERPHPGAQLRITDTDGPRVTAFATNTTPGGPGRQLPDLELRHRRRARAEDRMHPVRQGHRADQPAAARPRPEPHLVRPGRAGLRDHRLDPDARPGRPPRPPLGTQTPAPTAVLHRRTPGPLRPPNRASPGHTRTLGRPARSTPSPPCAPWPNPADTLDPRPDDQHDRPVEPAPRATSAKLSRPPGTITT
jgi:hypothetical protein